MFEHISANIKHELTFRFQASLQKIDMLAQEQSFPFDLGSAFAVLCNYLTTTDKVALASTCSLLRQVLMRGPIWRIFEITDCNMPQWRSFLCWVEKYLPIIQPIELAVTVLQEEHEEDKQLLRALLQPKEYVKAVSIRSKNQLIHLAIANACPNANRVTLHSSEVTDELVECMFKHMSQVSQVEIASDSLYFTLARASEYLKHPLQKLILKPYSLDYQELLGIVRDQHLNRLDELEIDVEQCEEGELVDIVSGLKHISRLRLYHMERFDRHDYAQLLADRLSPEMKELALTKCYYLDMTAIAQKVACRTLMALDLTEATKLTDESVLKIAHNCYNLRQLNLSWCNELTDLSIGQVVKRCPALERLTLNGLKSLTDAVFEEYGMFKPFFKEKVYDQVKYEFRKECKHAKETDLPTINTKYSEKASLSRLFQPCPDLQARRQTLGNLLFLECNSCNSVSDKILKIIYCFNRMAQVFNYYGEDLSLLRSSFEEEFID